MALAGQPASIEPVTETQFELREDAAAVAAAQPSTSVDRAARVVVITPAKRWPRLDLRELWHYRELLGTFAWRDIKVRYKQTFVGIAWALIQPFVTMVIFTIIFGKFAKFPSNGLPYPIFTYSALLPWTYFASALALASASLVANVNLVTKVYFPRLLLPLAATCVPVIDFLLSISVLVGMMAWFSVWPGPAVVLAPLFLVLAAVTAIGFGLFLSAVNVRYRDVPYAIPFVIQIWLYVSGVIFPISSLPTWEQWVLSLNPMTAVIAGFRWCVVAAPAPNPGQTLVSVVAALVFFVLGLAYFRRSEPRFADTI